MLNVLRKEGFSNRILLSPETALGLLRSCGGGGGEYG
jgi:hypothetical protein